MTNTIILIVAAAFGVASFACGITIISDITRVIAKLDEIKNQNKNI